jgi:hypothetical protein
MEGFACLGNVAAFFVFTLLLSPATNRSGAHSGSVAVSVRCQLRPKIVAGKELEVESDPTDPFVRIEILKGHHAHGSVIVSLSAFEPH